MFFSQGYLKEWGILHRKSALSNALLFDSSPSHPRVKASNLFLDGRDIFKGTQGTVFSSFQRILKVYFDTFRILQGGLYGWPRFFSDYHR